MRKLTRTVVLACIAVTLFVVGISLVDVEIGVEVKPVPEPIEIQVFADAYSVNGRAGTDLVNLLKGYDREKEHEGADVMVSASDEIGYWRVKNTIARLKDAGFEKVALASASEKSR